MQMMSVRLCASSVTPPSTTPPLPLRRYTTIPALLAMSPWLLSILSFETLQPEIVVEEVAFLNNDCSLDPREIAEARAEIVSQMHEQIRRALHSSAADNSELRGLLVQQTAEGSHSYFPAPLTTDVDDRTIRASRSWEDTEVSRRHSCYR